MPTSPACQALHISMFLYLVWILQVLGRHQQFENTFLEARHVLVKNRVCAEFRI